MKAIQFESFEGRLRLVDLPDPSPADDGVVIRVHATGLCRSDWHGWMGHDSDVRLPHVPGHEFAGVVQAIGSAVHDFRVGDRVTVPFSVGCGHCPTCREGELQVCDHYFQPGFTANGSFAELVAIPHADLNLVRLPDSLGMVAAASLGCRYATAYHALTKQARLQPGQWLAVHGCGGVGLAAIQLANAFDVRVLAIDIHPDALRLAKQHGAEATIAVDVHRGAPEDIGRRVRDRTDGGAHVSIDAIGGRAACLQSIASLRKRGTHVQIGLMTASHASVDLPMSRVIAEELRLVGSHGMAAHEYPTLISMITRGDVDPAKLVTEERPLSDAVRSLPEMDERGIVVFHC